MVKRDNLYFANVNLQSIKANRSIRGLEDGVLVDCQQFIEKLLKTLIKEKSGESFKIHNLSKLMNEYNRTLKKYDYLLRVLTDCYYDRRYETDDYIEYTKEEYEEIVDRTLELGDLLIAKINNLSNLDSFKK